MISRWIRCRWGWALEHPLDALARAGIRPAMLSVAGLTVMVIAGFCLANDRVQSGASCFLSAALTMRLMGNWRR
jgi:hypothetical protein